MTAPEIKEKSANGTAMNGPAFYESVCRTCDGDSVCEAARLIRKLSFVFLKECKMYDKKASK